MRLGRAAAAGEGGQGLMLAAASAPKAARGTGLVCAELARRSRQTDKMEKPSSTGGN